MKTRFKDNIRSLDLAYLESNQRKFLSPFYFNQINITLPLILEHATGNFIDLGCGDMPFRQYYIKKVTSYDTLDSNPRSDQITYVGDIQHMDMIPDNTYDSAICLEVLEHLPEPQKAVNEIFRILKPEGTIIISVPHLSRLHDEPHDYYRYTRYGLRHIFEESKFHIIHLVERGGLFAFLGHQLCLGTIGILGGHKGFREIALIINHILTVLASKLDKWFNTSILFPMGYALVAKKI